MSFMVRSPFLKHRHRRGHGAKVRPISRYLDHFGEYSRAFAMDDKEVSGLHESSAVGKGQSHNGLQSIWDLTLVTQESFSYILIGGC